MGSLKVLQQPVGLKKTVPHLLGVLQQSSDPNHSPLGSPPTEKKRVRRFSNSAIMSEQPGEEKENIHTESPCRLRSILKKPVSSARPSTTSMLTSALTRTRCSHKRNVNFSGHVVVRHIDDTETSYEPLKEHDRQAFLARNALRRLQASQQHSPPPPCYAENQSVPSHLSSPPTQPNSHHQHRVDVIEHPSLSTCATVTGSNNNPLVSKNVNISFSQQQQQQDGSRSHVTSMKFVVFMGPQYDPCNVVVKANMSGTRLRVVTSLKPKGEGHVAMEQYNERFQLPMAVDPYKVEARLDARGYLTVTAPLIEPVSSSLSV